MKHLLNFLRDEEGASAVEYALLVAGIAALIILVVYTLGDKVNVTLDNVQSALGS